MFFPRVNGVSTSIQTFVDVFRSAGHEVTLIAPEYPLAQPVDFDVLRIPSRRLPLDPEDLRYVSGYVFPFHFTHPVTGKPTSEPVRNAQLKPLKLE